MENRDNRNIEPEVMPYFVISPVMEKVLDVIGKLSMYPSQIDSAHLKRGASEMLDNSMDNQPELDFDAPYIDRSRV